MRISYAAFCVAALSLTAYGQRDGHYDELKNASSDSSSSYSTDQSWRSSGDDSDRYSGSLRNQSQGSYGSSQTGSQYDSDRNTSTSGQSRGSDYPWTSE